MPAVIQTMTLNELDRMLKPLETMDTHSFCPQDFGENEVGVRLNGQGRPRFVFQGDEYKMEEEAYYKLCQMVGIPGEYAKKTPHDIMFPHVNYWMRNKDLREVGFGVQDGKIVLFCRGEFNPIMNRCILDAVTEVMGQDVKVHHAHTDMFNTNFSIVTEQLEHAVAVGDVVHTGVNIKNSYAMLVPTQIASYVNRLRCTNGATSTDIHFSFSRRGDGPGSDEWIRDAITRAVSSASTEIDRLRDLQEIRFEGHLSDVLSSLFAELGVPRAVRDQVQDRIVDNPIDNMYELYNIITDIASNDPAVLNNPALSQRLMQAGGRIASHPEVCGNCHRVMR